MRVVREAGPQEASPAGVGGRGGAPSPCEGDAGHDLASGAAGCTANGLAAAFMCSLTAPTFRVENRDGRLVCGGGGSGRQRPM